MNDLTPARNQNRGRHGVFSARPNEGRNPSYKRPTEKQVQDEYRRGIAFLDANDPRQEVDSQRNNQSDYKPDCLQNRVGSLGGHSRRVAISQPEARK